MGRKSLLGIDCVCGFNHAMTPTAMAVALQAYQNGEGIRVTSNGVEIECVQKLLISIDTYNEGIRKDRVIIHETT